MDIKRFKRDIAGPKNFAILLEQLPDRKRQVFVTQAKNEDPRFVDEALRKAVFFEDLVYMEKEILAELFSFVSARLIAMALHEQPSDIVEFVNKQLTSTKLREVKDEEDLLDNPGRESVASAQRSIVKVGRKLEDEGRFIFEIIDCPRFHKKK